MYEYRHNELRSVNQCIAEYAAFSYEQLFVSESKWKKFGKINC